MKNKGPFVPVARPGTKRHPLLSRTGVPGWETETTGVSQPGQINVFVVVVHVCFALRSLDRWRMLYDYPIQNGGYWSEQFQVFLSCTPWLEFGDFYASICFSKLYQFLLFRIELLCRFD